MASNEESERRPTAKTCSVELLLHFTPMTQVVGFTIVPLQRRFIAALADSRAIEIRPLLQILASTHQHCAQVSNPSSRPAPPREAVKLIIPSISDSMLAGHATRWKLLGLQIDAVAQDMRHRMQYHSSWISQYPRYGTSSTTPWLLGDSVSLIVWEGNRERLAPRISLPIYPSAI